MTTQTDDKKIRASHVSIPNPSLVVMVGVSGSGKTTLASKITKMLFCDEADPRKHMNRNYCHIGSDECRAIVCGDPRNQSCTPNAFAVFRSIIDNRLAYRQFTIADATNLRSEDRNSLVRIAKANHLPVVAIVLHAPHEICVTRNEGRTERPAELVKKQSRTIANDMRWIQKEGFDAVYHVDGTNEGMAAHTFTFETLPCEQYKSLTGPFDIIGDIHGCADELKELLRKLGYADRENDNGEIWYHSQTRRTAVFLGDLCDRGNQNVEALKIVLSMVEHGHALWCPGNHDRKLARVLRGVGASGNFSKYGIGKTLEELLVLSKRVAEDELSPDTSPADNALAQRFLKVFDTLPDHYVLDGGRLVVAHAGLTEKYHGRVGKDVMEAALYGVEKDGKTQDADKMPEREDWAASYKGRAVVVYGHNHVQRAIWRNNTICIDTDCVQGGELTALRYPERELVAVKAKACYYGEPRNAGRVPEPEPLEISSFFGERTLQAVGSFIRVSREQMEAGIEATTCHAIDPRRLIYIPPTMSPCESSAKPDLLEHTDEALAYYRSKGLNHVVLQEKHMGSRACLLLCRDEGVANRWFGASFLGDCWTRTGRRFFDGNIHTQVIAEAHRLAYSGGLFDSREWALLDCEIMPWNLKAAGLLVKQYAATGTALSRVSRAMIDAAKNLGDRIGWNETTGRHNDPCIKMDTDARDFITSYRNHCQPMRGLSDVRIAPFHLLADDLKVYEDHDNTIRNDLVPLMPPIDVQNTPTGLFVPTQSLCINIGDMDAASEFFDRVTSVGGEGVVVKPTTGLLPGEANQRIQPAIKVRGKDYLRIIYGPHYLWPEHLERLKKRGVDRKRRLAAQQAALGLEALRRFVGCAPIASVHECIIGILGLDSESLDPRL